MQVFRPALVIAAIAAGAGLLLYRVDRALGIVLGVGVPVLAMGVAVFVVCARVAARRRWQDARA